MPVKTLDENGSVREYNAALAEMTDASDQLAAEREACVRDGGDPSEIDLAIWNRKMAFLKRVAPLETVAVQAAVRGRPEFDSSLHSWRINSENACRAILESIHAARPAEAAVLQQQFATYQASVAPSQRINDAARKAFGLAKGL